MRDTIQALYVQVIILFAGKRDDKSIEFVGFEICWQQAHIHGIKTYANCSHTRMNIWLALPWFASGHASPLRAT